MDAALLEILLTALVAVGGGMYAGWRLAGDRSRARTQKLSEDWQHRFDIVEKENVRLAAEADTLQRFVEVQGQTAEQRENDARKLADELEVVKARDLRLTQNVVTLRDEREKIKARMAAFQARLELMQKQSSELQDEFSRSRDFYKRELEKSFRQREALAARLAAEDGAAPESISNGHDETPVANPKVMEEIAGLRHDDAVIRRELDALKQDAAARDQLKVENRELLQALKSMQNTKDSFQYADARDSDVPIEQQSETLQLRIDDVEKNFREIELQQRVTLDGVRDIAANDVPVDARKDNLREIIGIGRVFEHALNQIGINSFEQIASLTPPEINRIKSELEDLEGRLEQDDWIGQAKALCEGKEQRQ